MSVDVVGMLVATNYCCREIFEYWYIFIFGIPTCMLEIVSCFSLIVSLLVVVVKVVLVVVVAVVVTEVVFGHLFSLLLEPGFTSKQPSSFMYLPSVDLLNTTSSMYMFFSDDI